MAFWCRRLPPELINELIKFVDGPVCRKRLISTNTLCYFLLHNTKRVHCWRVDARHLSETTARYGPNRLLALLPSVAQHRSAAKFFYTLAFWGHDGVGQHVTIRDFQEVTQPEQHLRFYISLNGGDNRQPMRAFFGSQHVTAALSLRFNVRFHFIPMEDERCPWDLASVTFENENVLCENWDGLMVLLYDRLFQFIMRV